MDDSRKFVIGDRVAYNDYDCIHLGTVRAVYSNGFRITWDDGYEDESDAVYQFPEIKRVT